MTRGRKSIEQRLTRFFFSEPQRDFIPFRNSRGHLRLQRVFMVSFQERLKRFIVGTETPGACRREAPRGADFSRVHHDNEEIAGEAGRGCGRPSASRSSLTCLAVILGGNLKATCFKFSCGLFNNLKLLHWLPVHQGNGQTDTLLKQTPGAGSSWLTARIIFGFLFWGKRGALPAWKVWGLLLCPGPSHQVR